MHEEASKCDSWQREEVVYRSRYRDGLLLELLGRVSNDCAKFIQGSSEQQQQQQQTDNMQE